jgi:ferredoxin-NADP reductase
MSTYETRLSRREEIAEGTMAFSLEKPAGFAFKPGQAIELALGAPAAAADSESTRHAFSLVSAPFESELTVATRLRESTYKRALKALPLGAPVQFEGPFGSLTLHKDRTRPAVLIAGGIGITPFMSILRQAANDQLRQQLTLIYSNRRPEDAAFLVELQKLALANAHFQLVATMTQMSKSAQPWNGETGPIDEALLKKVVADVSAPIYYLVGPPRMLEAMRTTMNKAGVDDDDIRSEEFFGY